MATYITSQGKSIDMGALIKKNEHVRAVGNMSVNSRGDTIDANGRIIESVNNKVSKEYKRGVTSGPVTKRPSPQVQANQEMSAAEKELEAEADAEEMATRRPK